MKDFLWATTWSLFSVTCNKKEEREREREREREEGRRGDTASLHRFPMGQSTQNSVHKISFG